jgi:hypothetical protein
MTKSENHLVSKPEKASMTDLPRWLISLLFLIPVLLFLPGIFGKIPYPSESALYTDLMLTHYPNALYLKSSIIEFQQIPLWSTLIHSGAPFAANPLSGLFYIPGWLALLFPLPEGISIVLAAHVVFATWGMYLLLKEEGLGELGAIAGGLIVGLMPKVAAHYGAGHVSMIYAISWTPWLFLVSKKDRRGWKTGIVAALLFLADPRWAVYAGIFWLTYDIAHSQKGNLKYHSLYYLKAGITAFLIASPLIVPLYEYIGLSTRPRMGLDDIQAFSLSPERIFGLIIPTGGGNPEWYLYFGGIVFGLFLMQLFVKKVRRENRFWNIWIVFSLMVSFGSWFINPEWLIKIPIISLLRVPARALFILGFSFSVISARTINYLTSNRKDFQILSKIAFGLALVSMGLAVPIIYKLGEFSISAIWGFGFLFTLSLVLLLRRTGIGPYKWTWIIVGLLVLDLLGAGTQSYYLNEIEATDQDILRKIDRDQEVFRLYSPSYSYPQHLAAENGVQLADGVDPMQIAAYSDFMERASGVNSAGYSVTIPAFKSGNPKVDNVGTSPNAFLLSLLNVKYVISEFEIENPDLQKIINKGQVFLYENIYLSERAWVEERPKSIEDFQGVNYGNVSKLDLSPNRIEIFAQGPGRLVLSEVQYPGWKVVVDGNRQPIELAYGLLRSVNLPEGDHEVEFYFRPLAVYIGLGMAMIGWILAIWQIYRKEDDEIQEKSLFGSDI